MSDHLKKLRKECEQSHSESHQEMEENSADPTKEQQQEDRPMSSVQMASSLSQSPAHSLFLDLCEWGLPCSIVKAYKKKGIEQMFRWQSECLMKGDVLNNGNLVYSAPTSAGKTLVSEILLAKVLLERRCKGLVILPFVSVAREKMFYFQQLFKGCGIRVGGFMGSLSPPGGFQTCDLAICTIERANSLINRLLEEKKLSDLGMVVVDELHLLSDPSRGYLLELLLTKLLYMQERGETQIQIVGMSATLPNLDMLAGWLAADLYSTSFRPVPLAEHVKIGKTIYDNKLKKMKDVFSPIVVQGDSEDIVYLCLDTVVCGHSVLVFCPTKAWCEKLADNIAQEFWKLGNPEMREGTDDIAILANKLFANLDEVKTLETLEHLKNCPAGLDSVLSRTVRFGVAFHHAGLTFDERDVVEGAFRQGSVKVLVATSTLSSGVNLPARRVIVRSPMFGGSVIDALAYRQMIGRAGRQGMDSEGESILICKETERAVAERLLKAELPPVQSCLMRNGPGQLASSVKRALLEVVASGICKSVDDLRAYANCTLLSASMREEGGVPESLVSSCVDFLVKHEFVRHQAVQNETKNARIRQQILPISKSGSASCEAAERDDEGRLVATQLGLACLASALSPDESLAVFEDLEKARRSFNLESDLHMIFQVTPIHVSEQWTTMNWLNYMNIWESLPADKQRVGTSVGVEERFLVRALKGLVNTSLPKQGRLLAIHYRFYTALALHDLVNEVPLGAVATKYGCNKGMLQSLQQQASTFAGMVTAFCRRLGWSALELLLDQFQDRLNFGIQRDLIDLVKIPSLNAQRARILHKAGLLTVQDVAQSKAEDLEVILINAVAFESAKEDGGEFDFEKKKRAQLRRLWITGRQGLTERDAAALIIEEAREIVQKEVGIDKDLWSSKPAEDSEKTIDDLLQQPSTSQITPVRIGVPSKPHPPDNSSHESLTEKSTSRRSDSTNTSHQSGGSVIQLLENKENLESSGKSVFVSASRKTNLQLTPCGSSCTTCLTSPDMFTLDDSLTRGDLSTKNKTSKHTSACRFVTSSPSPLVIGAKRGRRPSVPSPSLLLPEKVQKLSNSGSGSRSRISQLKKCNPNDSFTMLRKKVVQLPHREKDSHQCGREKRNGSHHLNVDGSEHVSHDCKTSEISKSLLSEKILTDCGDGFTAASVNLLNRRSSENAKKRHGPTQGITPLGKRTASRLNSCSTPDLLGIAIRKSPRLLAQHALQGKKASKPVESQDLFMSPPKCPTENLKTARGVTIKAQPVSVSEPQGNVEASRLGTTGTTKEAMNPSVPNNAIPGNDGTTNFSRKYNRKHESDHHGTMVGVSHDISEICESGFASMKSNQISDLPGNGDSDSEIEILDNSPGDKPRRKGPVVSRVLKLRRSRSDDIIDRSPFVPKLDRKIGGSKKVTQYFCESKSRLQISKTSKLSSSNDIRAVAGKINPEKATAVSVLEQLEKQSVFSLAFACSEVNLVSNNRIGNFKKSVQQEVRGIRVGDTNMAIGGLAVCWREDQVYFISLEDPAEATDTKAALKSALANLSKSRAKCIIFDVKSQSKLVLAALGLDLWGMDVFDPKVASWMLDPTGNEVTLLNLAKLNGNSNDRIHLDLKLLKGMTTTSLGCDALVKGLPPNDKAMLECRISIESWQGMKRKLDEQRFHTVFRDVEVPAHLVIANLELNGFGFDLVRAIQMEADLKNVLEILEAEAFRLAGRSVDLVSPDDVARVIYMELNLSLDKMQQQKPQLRKGRLVGPTDKDTLAQFKQVHPFPGVVLEWRRVSSCLNKILLPLIKTARKDNKGSSYRVYSTCNTHTATGRVNFLEPSVQMVPRDFEITLFGHEDPKVVSVRSAFVAKKGYTLVSADYSQLELRILAHFSEDPSLVNIFREDGDVFVALASYWKRKPADQVTAEERQYAKQICYGIIYGQGSKSLAEKLEVVESVSEEFMRDFKDAYPGLFASLSKTIEDCRKVGYVETILKRRRYLPDVSSIVPSLRGQAERQAVNTKIQGSAADLVKVAMVRVDQELRANFSTSGRDGISCDIHLVLDLHDELMYEVPVRLVERFAPKLKKLMRDAIHLKVPLDVKLKSGYSWGSMTPIL